jgi:hypothetical protein
MNFITKYTILNKFNFIINNIFDNIICIFTNNNTTFTDPESGLIQNDILYSFT